MVIAPVVSHLPLANSHGRKGAGESYSCVQQSRMPRGLLTRESQVLFSDSLLCDIVQSSNPKIGNECNALLPLVQNEMSAAV